MSSAATTTPGENVSPRRGAVSGRGTAMTGAAGPRSPRSRRHWRDQTGGRTFYDEDILAFADPEDGGGADGGQFSWLRKYGVDDMTVPAAELVHASQRASTSMLQTKLKLGFARASRVMDELETYGIIGPQDPRNPATPRQIYGPDNWLIAPDDETDA